MKIYYAHSMHLYGKPQEQRDIHILKSMSFYVVNPSDALHEKECEAIRSHGEKSNYPKESISTLIMDYFVGVVKKCDALAFRAHPDGRIPSGVGKEVQAALAAKKIIIELPNLLNSRFMEIGETRQWLELLGER